MLQQVGVCKLETLKQEAKEIFVWSKLCQRILHLRFEIPMISKWEAAGSDCHLMACDFRHCSVGNMREYVCPCAYALPTEMWQSSCLAITIKIIVIKLMLPYFPLLCQENKKKTSYLAHFMTKGKKKPKNNNKKPQQPNRLRVLSKHRKISEVDQNLQLGILHLANVNSPILAQWNRWQCCIFI